MAEGGGFEMGDFDDDPEESLLGPDEEEESSFMGDLPEPPLLSPSNARTLQDRGDRIASLQGELKKDALRAQRDRLISSFYDAIKSGYDLQPTNIEYERFEVDKAGKTLYWVEGDKRVRISSTVGSTDFVGLSTLARRFGPGGTQAIRDFLNLSGYTSTLRRTDPEIAALEKFIDDADDVAKASDVDLDSTVDNVIDNLEWDSSGLPENSPLLLPMRELLGLDEALKTLRGAKAVQESKTVYLQRAIEDYRNDLERPGTSERADQIEQEIQKAKDELEATKESIDTLNLQLRSQVRQIRETITRVLDKNTSLAERLRTLFREQGVTIASLLTALGFIISTLVLALTGGSGVAPSPAPPTPPKDEGGIKEWAKKHLKALGHTLAQLAGKAAAALPGIIGSIISWLLNLLSKTAGWLAENLWALVVAIGGLLIVIVRERLA